MDLYRYFHPHHNPRLRKVPLRLQELAELEQAATELERALKRAELRAGAHEIGDIEKAHFTEVLLAANYIVESLSALTKAHPGDSMETMQDLLKEREDAPGWENWARLLGQRLGIICQYESTPEPKARNIAGAK